MGNNELLLAISDMMDQKLDCLNVRMDTMENRLSEDIRAVEARLDAKIDAVEEKLTTKIDAVEAKLTTKINAVEAKLTTKINAVQKELKDSIRETNVIMENVLIPRMKHIEQCYLTTSERYINETGRIDGLVFDVQVIKSVVQNHSEQLQKIS